MRESTIMLIQYATGVLALALVGIHLALHGVVVPYFVSLEFERIVMLYKSPFMAAVLGALLLVVTVHGLNGMRVILLEWRQGEVWEKAVRWGLTALGAFLLAVGTRTLILVPLLS